MTSRVVGVHRSAEHTFSKEPLARIRLIEGIGVEGDAHAGTTVKHRSRVAKNPSQPNLRQVHLIHRELFDLLGRAGYRVNPGELGENITTEGVNLLALPVGTRLTVGDAVVTVTGLRNPCQQINDYQQGLLKQVLRTNDDGDIERLTGVMGIVSRSGVVQAGDAIAIEYPPEPHLRLAPV
ncbi:MOSC domain-containing protein YiiM [Paramicrobacterium humi]|uniref:MOSC domain-containing protein YiiM n=1 Tax=Paramicrobacterium humi TaxID=640635 RepID=A0A1H4T105_9MICO|nr:MOSC domain-containing protein [Microbacterium humi]SEC50107.1 MOSC domain-containing protein YiiM [Microbacterium humi]